MDFHSTETIRCKTFLCFSWIVIAIISACAAPTTKNSGGEIDLPPKGIPPGCWVADITDMGQSSVQELIIYKEGIYHWFAGDTSEPSVKNAHTYYHRGRWKRDNNTLVLTAMGSIQQICTAIRDKKRCSSCAKITCAHCRCQQWKEVSRQNKKKYTYRLNDCDHEGVIPCLKIGNSSFWRTPNTEIDHCFKISRDNHL